MPNPPLVPANSVLPAFPVFRAPYVGLGLLGRELGTICSSDIVVITSGQSGTLGEFAIAFEEGKLIGVLAGTGGVADGITELDTRPSKPTGADALYDADPVRLVDRLLAWYIAEATSAHGPTDEPT